MNAIPGPAGRAGGEDPVLAGGERAQAGGGPEEGEPELLPQQQDCAEGDGEAEFAPAGQEAHRAA